MTRRVRWVLLSMLAWLALPAWAQTEPVESRGRLLYANHCIACHDTQMHWRDGKRVTDWASLRVEVQRWQAAAQLNWSREDVEDVARYLDQVFYRLPQGGKVVGAATPGTVPR